MWMRSSGIEARICQLATIIFSHLDPSTTSLLQVTKDGVLDHGSSNPSMTNTRMLKSATMGAWKSSGVVQNPPHSSEQPECGWLAVCAFIYMRTPPTHCHLKSGGHSAYMEAHFW